MHALTLACSNHCSCPDCCFSLRSCGYNSPCSDVHREIAHHADTQRERCSDRTVRASGAEAHPRPPSWWVGAHCHECDGLREARAAVDVSRMIHALHLPYIFSLLMLFAPLLVGAPIGHQLTPVPTTTTSRRQWMMGHGPSLPVQRTTV